MVFMANYCHSFVRTFTKNISYSLNLRSASSFRNLFQTNTAPINFRHIHSNVNRVLLRPQKDNSNFTSKERLKGARSTLYYVAAAGVLTLGLSYASVPLYRMFCQAYSYGGTTGIGIDGEKVENLTVVQDRILKIKFNADLGASMRWNFKPQQSEIKVLPGETALAFYTAKNPTDNPVIGISTYNVVPFEAGQYFNKIQCFCFEEQMLNPHEEVDMPVFFYIDPEFVRDPKMEFVDTIMLSYTFFEAKEGMKLPIPAYVK